jgi:hypothetical protein
MVPHRWDSVFLWLWLGHMYMGSKGFPMHTSPSPVYSETLARCNRVVYSLRFLLTMAHWWASVFLWLWLGHMYMGNKDLPMHSSRSLVNGETLDRCTYAVYPPRFLRTMPRWGASVFHVLWLGHMYMGTKGFPMHSYRSPVYGETLALCTRVAYPLDFSG